MNVNHGLLKGDNHYNPSKIIIQQPLGVLEKHIGIILGKYSGKILWNILSIKILTEKILTNNVFFVFMGRNSIDSMIIQLTDEYLGPRDFGGTHMIIRGCFNYH